MHHTTLLMGFSNQIWLHWAFLKEFDLWMTFDLLVGHFEKMSINYGTPPLPPVSSFSSIARSITKRIPDMHGMYLVLKM